MKRAVWLAAAALALAGCASGGGGGGGNVKPYPLDTCLVTGSRLGSMGDPVTKVYDGQEVKFCCAACIEEFEQDPGKFLKMLPR